MAVSHRPRGPGRFSYTWQEIADLLGLSLLTAKRYGQGAGRKFNPRDLRSLFEYALSRRAGR